jgi:hypothetical protein
MGRQRLSSVERPKNAQQTETFWAMDRTGDCRRKSNLRVETAFFSKASYFVILVQF